MIKMFRKKYLRPLFFIVTLTLVITPIISLLSFAQEENVKAFVDKVAQELISTVNNPNASLKTKRNKVKKIINKNFDVTWMSKFAMGINYKKLSSSQKKKYRSWYLSYLVDNYFPILIKYDNDDSYEILKIQPIDNKDNQDYKDYDAKIKLITDESQNPIILKYRIRYTDRKYKCLDMVVEGVSTLISHRAEFTSIIQQSGIKYLLGNLRSKHDRIN